MSLRALENVSGKADASNPQGAEVTKDSSFFFCVLLLRPYRLLYRQSMTKLKAHHFDYKTPVAFNDIDLDASSTLYIHSLLDTYEYSN